MKRYEFYAGKDEEGVKNPDELKADLKQIVDSFKGQEAWGFRLSAFWTGSECSAYEIANEGAIDVHVSKVRDISVDDKHVNGLVYCLGFDENSEVFKKLDAELTRVCEVYHEKRVSLDYNLATY